MKNTNEVIHSMESITKIQLKYIEKNKSDMKVISDCKDKIDDFLSNKNRLITDIDSLKSFLLFQYMTIDKKLAKIREAVIRTATLQESEMAELIK